MEKMTKNELVASGILEQYVLGLCTKEEEELVDRMASEDRELRLLLSEMKGTISHCCSKRLGKHEAKHRVLSNNEVKPNHLRLAHTLRKKSFWNTAGPVMAILAGCVLVFAIIQMRQKAELKNSLSIEGDDTPIAPKFSPLLASLLDDDSTKYIQFEFRNINNKNTGATLLWNDPLNMAMLKILHLPPLNEDLQYHIWCSDKYGMIRHLGRLTPKNDHWIDVPYDLTMLHLHLAIDAAHDNVNVPQNDQIVAVAHLN